MKYSDHDIQELTNIVEQLKRDFPGRSLKRIVKDAERVYLNRKTHKPIKSRPPEHVLRNIERVKKAEEERRTQGRSLPRAAFVQGGTTSNHDAWRKGATPLNEGSSAQLPSDSSELKQVPQDNTLKLIEGYDYSLPEEVDNSEAKVFREGSIRQVTVNAYERNSEARRKCISHYGARCYVCGFDFENRYGEVGRGFIHIHHERPLATIAEEYEVNPIEDLKPVCPNCHAIIHRRKPPYTITEVKQILRKQNIA
jgi:predicted restriction endonuclease